MASSLNIVIDIHVCILFIVHSAFNLSYPDPLAESKTIYQAFKHPKAPATDVGNGHVKHSLDVTEELPAVVLAEKVPEQAPEIKKLSSGIISGKKKTTSTKPQKTDEELLQEALAKVLQVILKYQKTCASHGPIKLDKGFVLKRVYEQVHCSSLAGV